jgi:hypothetical protein
MSLNESIAEDAALEWFGELGYAVGHGPHLAPGEPAADRGIERGTSRLQTGGRAMKPRLPIPTGLRHSAQGCRVGEATLGHRVDYFPQRGCITVRARGFSPVGVGFPSFGLEKGFLDDFLQKVEAEVAADYMGQAEGLLKEGQTGAFDLVPAADAGQHRQFLGGLPSMTHQFLISVAEKIG